MKSQSEKGFAQLILILLVVALVVVAGVAFYMQRTQQAAGNAPAANVAQVSQATKLASQVRAYYQAYSDILVSGLKSGDNNTLAGSTALATKALTQAKSSNEITANFKTYLGGSYQWDPLLCHQQIIDQPITADEAVISGDTATVAVHQGAGNGWKVTLKKSNGIWKIDSQVCPS